MLLINKGILFLSAACCLVTVLLRRLLFRKIRAGSHTELVVLSLLLQYSRIQIISATVMDWRGGEASC